MHVKAKVIRKVKVIIKKGIQESSRCHVHTKRAHRVGQVKEAEGNILQLNMHVKAKVIMKVKVIIKICVQESSRSHVHTKRAHRVGQVEKAEEKQL